MVTDYTDKRYDDAFEWLSDAVVNKEVKTSELLHLIVENVPAEVLEGRFQQDLARNHFFDARVQVTWRCPAADHDLIAAEYAITNNNRFWQTIEWRDSIEGTGYSEDGFPERECPVCGYTISEDEDNAIADLREIKS